MTTSPQCRYILLTGVPRSGTTLTCYLLNKLPDTVALNEPLPVSELGDSDDRDIICDQIDRLFQETRRSLLKDGTVVTKHVGGQVPDDPFDDAYPGPLRRFASWLSRRRRFGPGAERRRRLRVTRGVIAVDKQLSPDFVLCVKHPAAFTALLDCLVHRFPCYAVVRNPLSVLASWNSCQMNVRNGHSPAAEHFDPDLARSLSRIGDRFDRQLYLLSWYFARYSTFLPPENILRYEDIIASGGAALDVLTIRAAGLRETLENRNANRLYDRALVESLGTKMLKADGAYWEFYSRQSVEQVLEEIVG